MENLRWVVLGIAIVMYGLVIAFQNKKVWWTTGAAVIIVVLAIIFPGRIISLPEDILASTSAFRPRIDPVVEVFDKLINWNVLLIYLGSMIIAALFIYSKVPVLLADTIVSSTKNTGIAIVAILAMTGLISIFVENVATVLVMAPIAIALCKKIKMNPTPFMIGLAVMSNLEGTATLIGDPPSMIFASYSGYGFNDFFIHNGRISIFFIIQAGLLAGCVFFYFLFARNGKDKIAVEKEKVVSWFPFVLFILMIVGLAGISFMPSVSKHKFSTGIWVMGLGVVGLLWYGFGQKKKFRDVVDLVRELDWETIFFLIGIFVVIGAITDTGLLASFANVLQKATHGSKFVGFILILLVSVAISGFIDNVPYIMVMLPVAQSLATGMRLNPELFMFALLVGSCLGGNLTPYGASANVVSMGILKKEGYPIKFAGWVKVGVPFTLITTTVAALLIWGLWHK